MGKMAYLALNSNRLMVEILNSDFNELKNAASRQGLWTSFFKWLASFAAIYLLILDRTNWRTNMLTSLLVTYIFLQPSQELFELLRGDAGKWIAFVAVVLRLFFPQHFPDWLEIPGSLILLLVATPGLFAHTLLTCTQVPFIITSLILICTPNTVYYNQPFIIIHRLYLIHCLQ